MANILSIGLRSLMAFQSAIETSAQNLQNARTPFYSRKQIDMVSSMFSGGVEIRDVNRVFDETSNNNLLKATSALNGVETLLDNLSGLEKVLDSDTTSVSKYLNDSLTALQELSKDVSSPQMRGAYLAKLSAIANQLNGVGADIGRRRADVNQNIQTTVESANNLLTQIADLNSRISQSSKDMKADLMDQRNALVHQLSQYFDFNSNTDTNGSLTISLKNGIQLVSNQKANLLATSVDPNNSNRLNITTNSQSGQPTVIDNFITGGQIGGLISFSTQALDTTEKGLGRMALVIASVFNNQNKLGMDGNGNLGGNIFNDINDPQLTSARVLPNSHNTGSGVMSVNITSPNQLTTSDYQIIFTDATHYSLTRLSDNSVVASGAVTTYPATISADGFTTTITSGSFQAGDTFTIKPTMGALDKFKVAITDPMKLALAYPVDAMSSTANLGNGVIKVDQITDTTNAAFQTNGQLSPPIKIVFLSDTSYQIVNANTSAVMEGPVTYDPTKTNSVFPTPGGYDPGYRISLSGNVKSGDTFNLDINHNYTADNRNGLELAKLYSKAVVENGSMTLNEAYRYVANDISLKTNMAKGNVDSSTVIYQQAENKYNQISGVSDVEEMNNIAEYQQAYQACAEVVQVARSVFDTIVKLMG